jgi:hypothetical protein
MKSKNTILVTYHNLKKDHYDPPLEIQRSLRSSGALAEIVTPFSDLSGDFFLKEAVWKILTRLSGHRWFSFLISILFLLKGFEIYRQIKIQWSGFDRILVFDRISGIAARKATNGQIPIILLNHYGEDPYMTYMYKYGIEKRRFGYRLMQKMLISMFNQPIHQLLPTS